MKITVAKAKVKGIRQLTARQWRRRRERPLYLMLAPTVVFLILFSYLPMLGLVMALQDYKALLGFAKSRWVGMGNFERMLANPDFWEITRNTIQISLGKIVAGQLASVVFALLLNEVRHLLLKRVVQTLSYLPHFLSWVVFGGMLLDFLSTRGLLNDSLSALGLERIYFLGNSATFQGLLVLTNTWKGFGWGAVIYLAALAGIDPTLYEAASVDGANRWQRMRHITLPGIVPVIVLMATLALGRVLNAGFGQVLVLYNPAVYSTGDVISTWVYRVGLIGLNFSLGTAVGLVRGIVGLGFITLSYYLAGKLANYRIF